MFSMRKVFMLFATEELSMDDFYLLAGHRQQDLIQAYVYRNSHSNS